MSYTPIKDRYCLILLGDNVYAGEAVGIKTGIEEVLGAFTWNVGTGNHDDLLRRHT